MSDCIFCKIAKKEVPSKIIYENDFVMVFPDIRPVKPVHLLIVPKEHIPDFSELADDNLLGAVRSVIQKMVSEKELEGKGYRVVVNGGGAQAVDHLHFHLLGPVGSTAAL